MPSVLISGAGIAGATLAYWLLEHGWTPTLVERAPVFREGGYVLDFWGVGVDVAERMHLLARLRDVGCRMDALRFVRRDGTTRSAIGPVPLHAALGDRFLSIRRGDLARVLYDTVRGRMEVLFGDRVETLQQDAAGVGVTFQRGGSRRFDAVVGADGLHSGVRALAWGPPEGFERYLGYIAAAFSTTGYPRREEHGYVAYGEPGRQISRYALGVDQTVFLLVTASSQAPAPSIEHDAAAQRAWLRRAFEGAAWNEAQEVFRRLDRATDLYFDAVSQVETPAWSNGRVGLVGDAAYCPSLLAGQGSAFAMLGGYVLARELAAAPSVPEAFRAYETALRPFITKKQRAARSFASSFAPGSNLALALRDLVIRAMNIPGVGPWMMKRMFSDPFQLPTASPSRA